MRILIVNTSDIEGGAARAVYRLHKALLFQNIDSQMLVQDKRSDDSSVIVSQSIFQKTLNVFRRKLDVLPVLLFYKKAETLFSPAYLSSMKIVNRINEINPDIVHLHWINFGMLKIEDLTRIKSPIVWTLHDNWLFTGGCHIKWECEKYKLSCGKCPRISSNKENDLSRRIWNRKHKTFLKLNNLTIVALSKWLMKCSEESSLLKGTKHINIPNPIDTSIFKPFNKELSKELWNLPKNKKLILFGAQNATRDRNKGFIELCEALFKITNKNIEFVIFGSNEPKEPLNFGFKTHYLGHLNDDVSLIKLYSAVDVMVVPSLQENLSNAIMESLSCSTPVVAFNIGGNSDLIEHKYNGYLAKPFNVNDLANGIEWVLYNINYNELSKNSRKIVLENFDEDMVSKKYIDLYNKVLNN